MEKEMATHFSILDWRIPWTKEPGGLQSMGLQTVIHDWATNIYIFCHEQEKNQDVFLSWFILKVDKSMIYLEELSPKTGMMTCIVNAVITHHCYHILWYSMHFLRELISWTISKWLNSHPHHSLRHTKQTVVHKGVFKILMNCQFYI